MTIKKFRHQNEGDAWTVDDPKSLDKLEVEAKEILTEKQTKFFKISGFLKQAY